MTNNIIQLDDVSFSYEQSIALDHISLEVGEGEFWALDRTKWFG